MSHEDAPALDPEELAAYIDGRLSGTRKARVEEALARNEDDYEVFLESVRTLEAEGLLDRAGPEQAETRAETAYSEASNRELGEVEPPEAEAASSDALEPRSEQAFEPIRMKPLRGTVVNLGEHATSLGRRIVRWAPAASSLLAAGLALTFGLRFLALGVMPADFAKSTKPEIITETPDWDDPSWKRFRSAEPPPAGQYAEEAIAFRLGVRGVDLRIATENGDPEALRSLVRNTGYWARAGDLIPSVIALEDLADRLDGKLLPDDIDQQLDAAEDEVEADVAVDPVMKRRYHLGLWAETGRLAVLAGDAETLRSRRFRWHRTGLARNDPDRTEAATLVAAIKERLKRDPTAEADFETLGQQFVELIRLLAG